MGLVHMNYEGGMLR